MYKNINCPNEIQVASVFLLIKINVWYFIGVVSAFIPPHTDTIILEFQQSNYSVVESGGSVSVCVEVIHGIVGARTLQITLDTLAGDAQGE